MVYYLVPLHAAGAVAKKDVDRMEAGIKRHQQF
jgi:hypothetical protein